MRSLAVSLFSLLLTTIRSWPAMPVHVSNVCDSTTAQATKLPLKVVFFFNDCRNRLSVTLSADAQTTTNLFPSMSSKQASFRAKLQAVKFMASTSIIWSLIILKRLRHISDAYFPTQLASNTRSWKMRFLPKPVGETAKIDFSQKIVQSPSSVLL